MQSGSDSVRACLAELWEDRRGVVAALRTPRRGEKPRLSGAFTRLRGKDSNLDYPVQSRASYR